MKYWKNNETTKTNKLTLQYMQVDLEQTNTRAQAYMIYKVSFFVHFQSMWRKTREKYYSKHSKTLGNDNV